MWCTSGALAVVVTALLVCCNADSRQDQEDERFNSAGHKPRNLDSITGGNLVQEISRQYDYGRSQGADHKSHTPDLSGGRTLTRETRSGPVPPYFLRQYDYASPFGAKRESWPQYSGYYGENVPKRNFDEIDRTSFNRFLKKRNFDEIDQTMMPFPFRNKRFYHIYAPDSYEYIDMPVSGLDKKRYSPDFPMDEIDLSHFPVGHKRSSIFR